MLILTNFARFPATWKVSSGTSGRARVLCTFGALLQNIRSCDLVLINGDISLLAKLVALFLLCPFLRKPIVAVDLVLRRPQSRLSAAWKRFCFSRIDFFVHYFKDLTLYERYYGVREQASCFVPFKPNIADLSDLHASADGSYVLCFGWSMRDYDTFLDAVEQLPFPAAIPRPDFSKLREHGSQFSRQLDQLPANVLVLENDGTSADLIRIVGGAKIVAIPILKTSILSGHSVYLNAMRLKKCVIASVGPGVSDLLTDQALIVPRGDPNALANMIRRAWEDDALRTKTAESGFRYAVSLGGEAELRQRILEQVVPWFQRHVHESD